MGMVEFFSKLDVFEKTVRELHNNGLELILRLNSHYFKAGLELRSPIMKNGLTIMASPVSFYN